VSEKARVSWNKVLDGVDQALVFFQSQGVKPTLRTLFYNLYSRGLIGNTRSQYQTLSKVLVKARQQGRYAWDFLEDRTRVVRGNFDDRKFSGDEDEDLEKSLEDRLQDLDPDKMIDELFDEMMPYLWLGRWADQGHICEVWIEKEALASTIENWIGGDRVNIRVNKGYSSWTFIYNNVESLKANLRRHDEISIFYLGDLDPSGLDIERFLGEALTYFEIDASQVSLERLGVTEDQVEQFNLPPKPEDAETLAKLQRDPRMAKYTSRYIVELDALVAYVPQEFRRMIQEAVRSVFDKELYQKLLDEREELTAKCQDLVDDYKEKAKAKIVDLFRGGNPSTSP